MPSSNGSSELAALKQQVAELTKRVRELERQNEELLSFAHSMRILRDTLVKMLAQAIEEANHWKVKVFRNGIQERD
jgi:regulator of replication initiation timing